MSHDIQQSIKRSFPFAHLIDFELVDKVRALQSCGGSDKKMKPVLTTLDASTSYDVEATKRRNRLASKSTAIQSWLYAVFVELMLIVFDHHFHVRYDLCFCSIYRLKVDIDRESAIRTNRQRVEIRLGVFWNFKFKLQYKSVSMRNDFLQCPMLGR